MEALLAKLSPLHALYLVTFATGLVLFFWSMLQRGIKVGPVVLPPISRKSVRGIALCIALLFITFSGYGTWNSLLRPVTTLNVLTGVAEEEFKVIREITNQFEKDHGVIVKLENADCDTALNRLEEEKVDLITFDVNRIYELVRGGLIEQLTEEKYKGLIPSSVNPVLLEHLEVNGIRYFAPYRPNVQLVFLNKERFAEMGIDYPKTWWDVKEVAERFYENDGEVRVVVQGTPDVIPLTMLQVIRSAGGVPYDLLYPRTKDALDFMRQLYQYTYPKSLEVDWQTACGFLLTDSVYLARNWCFSLSLIHESGRDADFEVYSGWSWSEDSKPSNLLGGEFLALPRNASHKDLAIELMKFFMSKEVQEKLAAELGWPPMRLDATGELPPWLQSHVRAINAALTYAEPVPDYWWPDMSDIYRRMFYEIVSLDRDADIESVLVKFQSEIDDVTKR
ncbi:hypothetical protein ES703_63600 [subsurface metagenome]